SFIDACVRIIAAQHAAFYAVLTYDGRQSFTPLHPVDAAIRAAFNAHQQGEKGFGPAAGPAAPAQLRAAFAATGFRVRDGDRPWRLGADDRALMGELIEGVAAAARATGRLDLGATAAWAAPARSTVFGGHTDTLALPGPRRCGGVPRWSRAPPQPRRPTAGSMRASTPSRRMR